MSVLRIVCSPVHDDMGEEIHLILFSINMENDMKKMVRVLPLVASLLFSLNATASENGKIMLDYEQLDKVNA